MIYIFEKHVTKFLLQRYLWVFCFFQNSKAKVSSKHNFNLFKIFKHMPMTMVKWLSVPIFAKPLMFEHHWKAYLDHLDSLQVPTRSVFYFLGPGFCLSVVFTSTCVFNIFAVSTSQAWLSDPWWGVTLYYGFFQESILVPQLIILFYYTFLTLLGLTFELSRSQRAPSFMIIFSKFGQEMLTNKDNRQKFERFYQRSMKMTKISTSICIYVLVFTVIISGIIQGCLRVMFDENCLYYLHFLLFRSTQSFTSSG